MGGLKAVCAPLFDAYVVDFNPFAIHWQELRNGVPDFHLDGVDSSLQLDPLVEFFFIGGSKVLLV